MKIDVYGKLVRDNIENIILSSGDTPKMRTLEGDEFLAELKAKLYEEVREYQESGEVSELADITEVVLALARQSGVSPAELEALRLAKQRKNGGFAGRRFLISVERGTR